MAGKAASRNSTNTNDNNEVLWVKKPASYSSREIRDEILRGLFAYTEIEIAELDRLKPGYFYINDSRNVKEWASIEQVKEWKTNSKGEVEITIPKTLIENLTRFRQNLLINKINTAILSITNVEVRRQVFQDLQAILNSFDNKRAQATENLMLIITGSPESAEQISKALSELTNQNGYVDNPFLILANAKASAVKYSIMSGPGYDIEAKSILTNAARVVSNNYNFKTYTHLSAYIRREESAYLNSRISQIYQQIGAVKESKDREWMARFYGVTETERQEMEEGDLIEIIPPGIAVVGTPSSLERELDKLKSERLKQRKIEEELDKGKQIVEITDPESGDSLEVRGQTRLSIEIKGSSSPNQQKKNAFPRGQNQRNLPPGKVVTSSVGQAFNRNGVLRMNRRAGLLDLVMKYFNAKTFNDRMLAITKYLAEKERLERLIRNEREYVFRPNRRHLGNG